MEDIWEKVLDLIKKELHPVSFSTWFDKTKLFKLTDDKVIIQVPMALHKKMLLSNYYDLINDSFAEVTGVERDIECLLEDEIDEFSMNTTQEGTTEKLIEDVINEKTYEAKFTFDSNLNKDLNFDNFVVGDTNKFAKTAALAVAENPGTTYNPLFIYGKSGIGKTHLMHAIGNYINETKPDLKVLYTTSDDFRKDYTGIANQNGNSLDYANDFKNKYRNIDVLIIDDIQYLVDAKKTQEEFFHTFNELHGKGKQIIISSDRSPEDLKVLEERLRSRFAWGLPVDIYPPDFDLRCRILKDKIKRLPSLDNKVTDEAIEFIANNFDNDVRSLEGAINRLAAYTAMIVPDKIDMEFTNEALKDYIKINPYSSNDIGSIQKAVADYYKITVEVLKGKRRSANIAYPRMVAMYLCRMLTDESFPRIGLEFGGRDHSTVIHAVDKIESDLKENSKLKEIMNEIKSNL
ncbi:MAG: chromosomal replication initiator protein DnaA [Bacilli bacterium]|jgi:chromosomal replication initiator protein|nr:chromosomal replication initiator protein DnaA [Bacilli bacterium]